MCLVRLSLLLSDAVCVTAVVVAVVTLNVRCKSHGVFDAVSK